MTSSIDSPSSENCGDSSSHSVLPTCGYANLSSQVSPQVVVDLISTDKYKAVISEFIIIDCRYDYEFEGGHIKNALNLSKKSLIKKFYERARVSIHASANNPKYQGKRRAVIFHCEYSQHRGPELARYFRSLDREANSHRYPHLDIEEVHVMKGGYREFFRDESFRKFCEPVGYVKMLDEKFRELCLERKNHLSMRSQTRIRARATQRNRRSLSVASEPLFAMDVQSSRVSTGSSSNNIHSSSGSNVHRAQSFTTDDNFQHRSLSSTFFQRGSVTPTSGRFRNTRSQTFSHNRNDMLLINSSRSSRATRKRDSMEFESGLHSWSAGPQETSERRKRFVSPQNAGRRHSMFVSSKKCNSWTTPIRNNFRVENFIIPRTNMNTTSIETPKATSSQSQTVKKRETQSFRAR
eukprot:CAMPEP_0167768532 /NCGR_PEP_ID=MMETSP0110_2-20121227/16725_1 /TAXON_ID=629695 /ORGANISM="Gymnochlora sp., Strain CCMP2014" /LENGTH=407 /DNA_ID=CAMNT_0007657227 /DNA_START=205 /DNA_END=1425 /DNA_ORIENTATION=+